MANTFQAGYYMLSAFCTT